jgi:hypothetical protein
MNQSTNIEENGIKNADFILVESQQHNRKTIGINIHHGKIKPARNVRIKMSKNRIIIFFFGALIVYG